MTATKAMSAQTRWRAGRSNRWAAEWALAAAIALLTPAPASAQSLSDLDWLKGCWRSEGGRTVTTEVWSAPPLPALVGYAMSVRDGAVRSWEQTRIELRNGKATFVAMPNGGPPVAFTAAQAGPQRVRFVNPDHDFPQVVEYVREGETLLAAVSALGDPAEPAQTLRYERIACSGDLSPETDARAASPPP